MGIVISKTLKVQINILVNNADWIMLVARITLALIHKMVIYFPHQRHIQIGISKRRQIHAALVV